jgi:hypothetical protein
LYVPFLCHQLGVSVRRFCIFVLNANNAELGVA